MSDQMPEEILIQILARLPVKSLLKFRCVSKSWYSLISSPDFINTHLSINNNTKNKKFLIFKHIVLNPLVKDECFFSLNHEDTLDAYACFEYAFKGYYSNYSRDFNIVGSCNGLLCISRYLDETIILWNPSIKKYVNLPTRNITGLTHRQATCVVGFGFDNRANEYKVVRLVQKESNFCPPKVELCELSKGSWRGISCNVPPCFFSSYMSQAYINGVVHWIALTKSNGYHSLIVAFDMVDEIFREMALPDSLASCAGLWENIFIATFEESLVVYHLKRTPSNNQCSCSVWVMQEYGVAKSWVNQYNVVIRGDLQTVQSLMKNGELLLKMTSGLVLCNPKDQQMKDVEFYGPGTRSLYVDTYMESLILLKGRHTDSCNAVISKRKEDEIEEQQYPTIVEEAKTTKKTRVEIGVGSSKSYGEKVERK